MKDDDRSLEAIVSAALGGVGTPPDGLAAALAEALRAGRLAWPELDVTPESFVARATRRLAPSPDAPAAARALHAADLYLACACARQDPRAIAAFEARYSPAVDRALARLKIVPPRADDLKGELREKLLFPPGGAQPLLSTYSGQGALVAWLRMVTMRAALDVLRASTGARSSASLDELDLAAPGADPELAYLKATFATEFKAALGAAIEALSVRERNLLRQHALDGLNIAEIGQVYAVHRATAARWVADVRGRLLDEVRQRLMARLRLSADELEHVMGLARSQLDVSVRRLLRAERSGA